MEMLNLYKQALSKPYKADSVEYEKFEFIFGFQNIWLENINKKTPENERKEKIAQMENYWKEHYVQDELEAFKAMSNWRFNMVQVKGGFAKTTIVSYEHLTAIKQMIKELGIEEFKKFLSRTRGARGRLMKIFGMTNMGNILQYHREIKPLLEIGKYIRNINFCLNFYLLKQIKNILNQK